MATAALGRIRWRMNFGSIVNALQTLPRRHPVIFGALLASAKTGGADYFAQKHIEGRSQLDRRQNLIFFTWGLVYLGGVQYFVQVQLFTRYLFPGAATFVAKTLREKLADRAGQAMVAKQVGLDLFVHHPFVLFPTFYQVKELIEGGTPRDAVRKCWANLPSDCCTLWAIWVPSLTVNFAFCPVWARIPFVACVSAVYTSVFSVMRGAPE